MQGAWVDDENVGQVFEYITLAYWDNSTNHNITKRSALAFDVNGGITFTLLINIIICAILFILFVCCLQPFLPLFNVSRKRRLVEAARVYEEQMRDENLTAREQETPKKSQAVEDLHEIELNDVKLDEVVISEVAISTGQTPQSNTEEVSVTDASNFKNLLNLTEEEPNVHVPVLSLLEQNRFLGPCIRQLYRIFAICKELLLYVVRVLLSFVSRKHNNADMRELCKHYSRDVAVYLLFQKQMIFALSLCMFLGFAVLFPLHLTGKEPHYEYQYEYQSYNLTKEDYPLLRTSISMVIESPGKLSAHVILCFAFIIIFAIFLHRFRTSEVVIREHFLEEQLYLQQKESTPVPNLKQTRLVSKYSIQIKYLPTDFASPKAFDRMIREELCPDLKVFKTVLMFTVYQRIQLQNQYKSLQNELERYIYLQKYKNKSATTWFLSFKHGLRFMNAVDYYRDKMLEVETQLIEWEKEYKAIANDNYDPSFSIEPAGYGFVIFETPEDAKECLARYYKTGTITKPIQESVTLSTDTDTPVTDSKQISFKVASAYEPDDISWDNILTFGWADTLRNITIKLAIFLVFIIATSPLAGLSGIQSLINIPFINTSLVRIKSKTGDLGNLVFQYLPTLILHLITICLPYAIWYLSDFSKFRSKSRYKRKLMSTMFAYLILTTLLMPSMLLTSFDAVITYLKDGHQLRAMFRKMFLPASGAFFLNYVLQCVLLKNFGDIIRIVNLFKYMWGMRTWPNITPKEKLLACELSEFYFEYEYPYMINVISMTLCYSILTPIILCFGWSYLLLKHLIDRYVIMYIYGHKPQAAKGVLSFDFRAHRKQTDMTVRMMAGGMFIFVFAMTIFFSTRVHTSFVLPHTIIVGLLLLVMVIALAFEHIKSISFLEFLKYKVMKLFGYQFTEPTKNNPISTDISSTSLTTPENTPPTPMSPKKPLGSDKYNVFADEQFIHAYEPPFQFIDEKHDFKSWVEADIDSRIVKKTSSFDYA